MGQLLGRAWIRDGLLGSGLVCCALTLVLWPGEAMSAAREGLALCGNVIIPSLFPFFILSSLVVELGLSRYLGTLFQPLMAPLFRVNGSCACALALGMVGGYPVGARTAIQLYQSGQCSRTEAQRLLAFCNNAGPAFLLGVVGAGVFGNGRIGLVLYLAHLVSSLAIGVLFRFYRPGDGPRCGGGTGVQFQTTRFSVAFPSAVTGALTGTLNICAFVLCFSVLIRMLNQTGVLAWAAALLAELSGLSPLWGQRLLAGLLEVSSGVSALTDGPLSTRLSMAAFLLGWSGLSVHCQVLALLGDSDLSMGTYLVGKALHGALSALLLGLLAPFLSLQTPVSGYLDQHPLPPTSLNLAHALPLSTAFALGMWLLCVLLSLSAGKKRGGTSR